MVYHGPKAMEELVRFDPHLVVGILGGSAGTTRDAFQLLADAQKYGARVALFGRKINNAENQLAFVQFLRLIVEGEIGPVEAVKAYHAVLGKLGIAPHRPLEDDLKLTEQSMSYGGTPAVVVPREAVRRDARLRLRLRSLPPANGSRRSRLADHCPCQDGSALRPNGVAVPPAACKEAPRHRSRPPGRRPSARPTLANGRPDFARMSPADRLAYHRERLGLGR